MTGVRVIELVENDAAYVAAESLTTDEAAALWSRFGNLADVEYPSPKTQDRWKITLGPWVGFLPLTAELTIAMRPKLGVRSVFAMLEYAYDLRSLRFLGGLYECGSLEELYGRVALILADRVRARIRNGIYRAYRPEADRLPYVRARLDTRRLAASPWCPNLPCLFEEHTADIEDNRLLLWALHLAARSGVCTGKKAGRLRDAHRALLGAVALEEYDAEAYRHRHYDRMNEDYRAMHALSRFIVENAGPRHERGEHRMVPFLVDMSRLYERFVGAWLRQHLPLHLRLERQDHLSFGTEQRVRFVADLVIRDRRTGMPTVLIDTKYKHHVRPSADDVAQVVAYATAWGVTEAVLAYPDPGAPWEARIGDVRVRALAFALDRETDEAGLRFMEDLIGPLT